MPESDNALSCVFVRITNESMIIVTERRYAEKLREMPRDNRRSSEADKMLQFSSLMLTATVLAERLETMPETVGSVCYNHS